MALEIKGSPIEYAESLSKKDLAKVIRDCKKAVAENYDEWLDRCRVCFEKYAAGEMDQAAWWSHHADAIKSEG